MFSRACRRMLSGTTTDPGGYRVIMVGDTMETDIRGSVEIGLRAYLVLTGSSRLEDLPRYVYQPTRVLVSVRELAEEIRTGKPVEFRPRRESPPVQPRRAGRHQTDVENYRGRYPRPPMTRGG
jgi:NagD protein